MASSTVYQASGLTTDTSLPIQFKDPAATSSTRVVFDALDTNSWPYQAPPNSSQVWSNLMENGNNATFPSAVMPGWDGGFTFDGTSTQFILGPANMKLASNALSGFYLGIWFKFATVAAGNSHLISLGNGTVAGSQYMIYRTGSVIVAGLNGTAGPSPSGVLANTMYHMALGYQGDGAGNFVRSVYLNGSLVGSATVTAASIVQPTQTNPQIGRDPNVGNFNGEINRIMFDDLTSGVTVANLVAADYAAGLGRFA